MNSYLITTADEDRFFCRAKDESAAEAQFLFDRGDNIPDYEITQLGAEGEIFSGKISQQFDKQLLLDFIGDIQREGINNLLDKLGEVPEKNIAEAATYQWAIWGVISGFVETPLFDTAVEIEMEGE